MHEVDQPLNNDDIITLQNMFADSVPDTVTLPGMSVILKSTGGGTIRDTKAWGRNWLCYCGSGKKYKKCCWKRDNQDRFKDAVVSGEYKES